MTPFPYLQESREARNLQTQLLDFILRNYETNSKIRSGS